MSTNVNKASLTVGVSNYRSGYTYNSICPVSQFAEYCVGRGVGYNDGYRSAEGIG
jgi:hypothetical protein